MASNGNVRGPALGFLAGGIVGTVVGILMAPKSGAETRADLAQRSEAWRTRAEVAAILRERAGTKVETVRDRVGPTVADVRERATAAVESVRKHVDPAVESVRERVGLAVEPVSPHMGQGEVPGAIEEPGDEPEDPQEQRDLPAPLH